MSVVKVLPDASASGGAQMALDDGLLQTAERALVRRYTWDPPALSIGKHQRISLSNDLPFDVVRRPSGGLALLHGRDFEWSFSMVLPMAILVASSAATIAVTPPYRLVHDAFAAAFEDLGVGLDPSVEEVATFSALCLSRTTRHDIVVHGEKIVALAQAKHADRVLVHGSVVERRPPRELVEAAERLLGEPWRGAGLAGAGCSPVRDRLWQRVLLHLEASLSKSEL